MIKGKAVSYYNYAFNVQLKYCQTISEARVHLHHPMKVNLFTSELHLVRYIWRKKTNTLILLQEKTVILRVQNRATNYHVFQVSFFFSFEIYLPIQRIAFQKANSIAKLSFVCSYFKIYEDQIIYMPTSFIQDYFHAAV